MTLNNYAGPQSGGKLKSVEARRKQRPQEPYEKGTIMLAHDYAPCPSCQGNYIHVAEWYSDAGESEYYCVCDECGYEDPDHFDDPYVAIDHWGRRVSTGYLGGEDPTDTEFDKLDESDWEDEDDDYEFPKPERKSSHPRRTRIERR